MRAIGRGTDAGKADKSRKHRALSAQIRSGGVIGEALKQPPRIAFAPVTLRSTNVPRSRTRCAFGPVILPDRALDRSFASLPVAHAPAPPVGQGDVIAGCSTVGTKRDWLGALHVGGKGILLCQRPQWLCLILSNYARNSAQSIGQILLAHASES
jgi:hypothetical protein